MTDDDLMSAMAEGREDAFRELVERWEQPIYAFLVRMVASHEDALDLSQETFLRVHTRARGYCPRGQFRCWLFTIAGNLARSWLRRQRVLRWVRFNPSTHGGHSDPGALEAARARDEMQRALRDALARLPDRQRQALILQRFGDMTQHEIAATLATTVPAVESLIQRAMARLRRDLCGRGGTNESPRR